MPREIYPIKTDSLEEMKEEMAQLKEENELLKGCVMEIAEVLFSD